MEQAMSVSPVLFRHEMEYLKDQGYTSISFADFASYATSGRALPEKPVIITFDDGWETQYGQARPILKDAGLTATFFLITKEMGHPPTMSWEQAKELMKN